MRISLINPARFDSATCVCGQIRSKSSSFLIARGRSSTRSTRSSKAFGEMWVKRPSRRTSRVSESSVQSSQRARMPRQPGKGRTSQEVPEALQPWWIEPDYHKEAVTVKSSMGRLIVFGKSVVLLSIVLSAFSCASVISGPRESIRVDSTPAGAEAAIFCNGIHVTQGVTPAKLNIARNAGKCTVTVSKGGFSDQSVALEDDFNPVYIVNVVTSPLVGAGVLLSEIGAPILGVPIAALGGAGWLLDYSTAATHRHTAGKVSDTLKPMESE